MLSKTKIALAAALAVGTASTAVIGTASTALARGYVLPGSMDGVNPAYHPRWFPDYPGVNNAPSGDPNALPPSFNTYGTGGNAYGLAPSTTRHKRHSPR
jgi:hypothetical protein